jgi:hypothetical protein
MSPNAGSEPTCGLKVSGLPAPETTRHQDHLTPAAGPDILATAAPEHGELRDRGHAECVAWRRGNHSRLTESGVIGGVSSSCQFSSGMPSSQIQCHLDGVYDTKMRIRGLNRPEVYATFPTKEAIPALATKELTRLSAVIDGRPLTGRSQPHALQAPTRRASRLPPSWPTA